MGWSSYHAYNYKNGSIDKKAECDSYFLGGLNMGLYNVKKSAVVGSVYYAAIENLKRYTGKDENDNSIYEDIPKNERMTWAAVFLTHTDMKDYYNFSYKDMSEDVGPCEDKCPISILKLLSPTSSECANEWRRRCYENAEKVKAERLNPHTLSRLPVGSSITFPVGFSFASAGIKKGDQVTLHKIMSGGRAVWAGYGYRWKKTQIPKDFEVLSA